MSSLSKDLHLEMSKIIFGPVSSRRLGISLGINALPLNKKSCSFNCVYCQLGKTNESISDPASLSDYPCSDRIIKAFEEKMSQPELPEIDVITIAGNGEPTLNPELGKIVSRLKEKTEERGMNTSIAILTNSSTLGNSSVRKGLKLFDRVVAKLDTVDQECFMSMNKPVKEMKVKDIVDRLKSLRMAVGERLAIQVMVIDSMQDRSVVNHDEAKIAGLSEAILEIDPDYVQIYSLDRDPAVPYISKVDRLEMDRIANGLTRKLGIGRVKVY